MAMSEVFNLDFKFGGNAEFLVKLEELLNRIDARFDSFESDVKETTAATDKMADSVDDLNDSFKKGLGAMGSFAEKLKDIAQYYLSFSAIRSGAERVWSFGMESMDIYATQERAENQLKGVMKNRGTLDQFQTIKDYAGEVQGRSIYGDEAMIKGAGELATYVEGTEALKSMMDLLTDYAAGMTGGGEVSPEQMESLATGLGMAYDGNYMAMRKKGFDTSKLEALDAIVETGGKWGAKEKKKYGDVLDEETIKLIKEYGGVTENMRVEALRESLEDWKGLSDEVKNLDSSAIIIFNNKLGDLRENIGKRLYPVFNRLIDSIDSHLPDIEQLFNSLAEAFEAMARALIDNLDDIKKVVTIFSTFITVLAKFPKEALATAIAFKLIQNGALSSFKGFQLASSGLGKMITKMKTAVVESNKLKAALSAIGGAVAGYEMTDAEALEDGVTGGVGGVLGGVATSALAGAKAFGVLGAAAAAAGAAIGAAFKSIKGQITAYYDMKEREEAWNDKSKGYDRLKSLQRGAIAARKRGDVEEERSYIERLTKARDDFESKWGEGSAGTGFLMTIAGGSEKYEAQLAEKRRLEAKRLAKDSKVANELNIDNSVVNNNITQKVNVAAEVEKIGMLLNLSVRAAIEQAMRQNKNQTLVGAV